MPDATGVAFHAEVILLAVGYEREVQELIPGGGLLGAAGAGTILIVLSTTNGALKNWGSQAMEWAEDDMQIVAEMAVRKGISLPQAGVTREICRALKPRRCQLDSCGR